MTIIPTIPLLVTYCHSISGKVSLIKIEGDSKGYIFLNKTIGHTGHKLSYHSAFPRCPSLHQSLRLSGPWEASGGRVFAASGPGPGRSDGDRSVARSFCKKVKSIFITSQLRCCKMILDKMLRKWCPVSAPDPQQHTRRLSQDLQVSPDWNQTFPFLIRHYLRCCKNCHPFLWHFK